MDAAPSYCTTDGETFSSQSQIGDLDEITRTEILHIANAIP